MKVATFNDCKVYNLSSGKTMPQWLSDSKKRALLKDEEYRRRLELIQDFEMSVASQCIKMTKDGEHVIVTGTYPPVVRCYTVSDLALKFQRGLTCEVVAFETLSDDFGKLVFLQNDRTLNFHAPYGTHYSVRVPKFGRDLAYSWSNCDVFVAGTGDEIYRLNLEHGQFKEPFTLGFQGCNKIHINPVHSLLGCGGENASCEFWDPRARKSIAKLCVDNSKSVQVTALKFDTDGLTLAVGTSAGNCILFDIRSSNALYTKEHQYGLPVMDVYYHNTSRHIISTDKKIVKIWERDDATRGKILTNIETPANINGVHVVEDRKGSTGLIFLAGEQSRVMTYFVPQLGHAPRWCSFLESLTEELEENSSQNIYEDYKFITEKEVEELGASTLVGTPLLRGYMHGFFIEMKLYNKLRAVSKPFEYEEYRLQKIREKIDEKRQSRITARKRLPKINKHLAQKLMGKSNGEEGVIDDRFAALFKREDFQVDEDSNEFKLRHPTGRHRSQRVDDDDSDEDGQGQPNSYLFASDEYDVDDDNDNTKNINENDEEADEGNFRIDNFAFGEGEDEEEEYVRGSAARIKGKNRRQRQQHNTEDDEGQFLRVTKRRLNAKLIETNSGKNGIQTSGVKLSVFDSNSGNNPTHDNNNRSRHTNGSGIRENANISAQAPVMFELPSGMSSNKAIFSKGHSHNTDRIIQGSTPLFKRLSNYSSETRSNERNGDTSGRGKPIGKQYHSQSTFKSTHTEREGAVREISYVPRSRPSLRSSKRDTRQKKESMLDRERAHFI